MRKDGSYQVRGFGWYGAPLSGYPARYSLFLSLSFKLCARHHTWVSKARQQRGSYHLVN
jgi:hypothetical protein